MKMHRALHVHTLSVVMRYSSWVLLGTSHPFLFIDAQSKLTISAATQFLRVATRSMFDSFCVDGCVCEKRVLFVTLHALFFLIDLMDAKMMVHTHPYDWMAVIRA